MSSPLFKPLLALFIVALCFFFQGVEETIHQCLIFSGFIFLYYLTEEAKLTIKEQKTEQ